LQHCFAFLRKLLHKRHLAELHLEIASRLPAPTQQRQQDDQQRERH
jgi:hypothetical protein